MTAVNNAIALRIFYLIKHLVLLRFLFILLKDKSVNSAILIESAVNSDLKKKSNTIPRSRSLLDKKSKEEGHVSSSSSREVSLE